MKTIVYANTIDYDFTLQQRPHHLMNVLADRGWKVYWINNTKVKGKGKDKINDNLEVWHDWDLFCKRNPEVDIYFSSWSHRYVDLQNIKAKVVVYDSLDNFEANEKEEINMIQKSDILLTTSAPLYQLRKNQHDNIHMCRNGCFPELGEIGRDYNFPHDLKRFNKPIVLFSGALAYWCDLELMERIAKSFTTVVVGKGWGIRALPKGVIYLGGKRYDELQAYYSHCNVSILPFKRCQIADFSNPIKNYEAMSHGKVSVATDIPEATIYPDSVLASKDHNEFINNIMKAVKMNKDLASNERCREIARENSWYHRVDIIEKAIEEFCKKNGVILDETIEI